jgi:gas vesicle protein
MARDNDAATGLTWFISGLVLGAVTALLLAPEAGEHTRRRIAKHAKNSGKVIADSSREVYEKGRELYERGRDLAEDAAEMFERGRKLAEKKIDEMA